MAIDAVIIRTRKMDNGDVVMRLGPRIERDGQLSLPGRRLVCIKQATITPVVGSMVWGGSPHVMIEPSPTLLKRVHYRRGVDGYWHETQIESCKPEEARYQVAWA